MEKELRMDVDPKEIRRRSYKPGRVKYIWSKETKIVWNIGNACQKEPLLGELLVEYGTVWDVELVRSDKNLANTMKRAPKTRMAKCARDEKELEELVKRGHAMYYPGIYTILHLGKRSLGEVLNKLVEKTVRECDKCNSIDPTSKRFGGSLLSVELDWHRLLEEILGRFSAIIVLKGHMLKAIISNSGHEIKESGQVKLKCILSQTGVPSSTISWTLNNRKLMQTIRHNIRTKKKRSILRIQGMLKSDSGEYKCKVHNIIGSSSASWQLTVKSSKASPSHQVSECPIESFCLNRGTCLFYEMIGELIKYKHSCGLYSHDYHLREICAVWRKSPDMKEMTYDEYLEWQRVEKELKSLRKKRNKKKYINFNSQD
ncbi:unnamed protein product [Lepeophtheirus salmonis]|uniref:(salmon louse) hypothetical protein n=1 Tax=Lepeophtheirus salmonis TaxID=72036 RepID=A0A7R8CGW7_LEPSM|nr:unnamed protein product [Lepeophtheirus salmonis]CAF2819239.1 unnamed protein product [Lepeophtheirus salmonis]